MLIIGLTVIVMYLLNFRFYSIKTGSMGNDYKVGTMLVVKKVDTLSLNIGDVISYTIDDNLTIVTHRIVEVGREYVITKGDAVDGGKAKVYRENIIGKEVISIPELGKIESLVSGSVGKTVLITVIIASLLSSCMAIYDYRKEKASGREQEKTE